MSEQRTIRHGDRELPAVTVDSYNAELRDGDGFLGDRANKGAFQSILAAWRERLRAFGDDPLGDRATGDIPKRELDRTLATGDGAAAGAIHAAIAEFAGELATVIRGLLALEAWRGTEQLVVGGGFRATRMGELAIGHAAALLKRDGCGVVLRPIRHHPDGAALLGAVHLADASMFRGHDSILAVDIGGTNIRAGTVELNLHAAPALTRTHVMGFELWRHGGDDPDRDDAVEKLGGMLREQARRADGHGRRLAPFIGIACPGVIRADGRVERGGQNLPGDWEHPAFNLPSRIRTMIPTIGGKEVTVAMHNDAVVQGLSELPWMRGATRWGVLTIGTGLGNARFTNRAPAE